MDEPNDLNSSSNSPPWEIWGEFDWENVCADEYIKMNCANLIHSSLKQEKMTFF